MGNLFNEKFNKFVGKMDDKMLKMKLDQSIDMLHEGSTQELAEKINKMDKEELLKKLNEIDSEKLNDLNIDISHKHERNRSYSHSTV